MSGEHEEVEVVDLTPEPEVNRPIVQPRLTQPVYVSDRIPGRQRRFEDIFEVALSVLGLVLVFFLGTYAQSTTQGVEEDVRAAFDSVIRQILFLPLSVLEGIFVISAPVTLVVSLVRRGDFATMMRTILTGMAAALVAWSLLLAFPYFPDVISSRLVVVTPTGEINSVNFVFMVLAAMATATGTVSTSKSVKFTWIGIWVLLFFSLIRGTATLPGIFVTILLGRLLGCAARWIGGFNDFRALPADLVEAAISSGLDPDRLVRIDVPTERQPLETWEVTESTETPDYRLGRIHPPLITTPVDVDATFVVSPQYAPEADRQYQVWDIHRGIMDLHVLDPDTGLTSLISDIWSNIRLRDTGRLISPAIKINAQREMLAAGAVGAAGVRTPQPIGLSDAGTSVAVFWQSLPPALPLLRLKDEGIDISDDALDQAWRQLVLAHNRNVCHRNLDEKSLVLDDSFNVWILNWGEADMGTGDLARRIDCAQMLVHLALATSVRRAVASARRQIGLPELLATSLVLQPAALPASLRVRARKADILDELRTQLSAIAPAVEAPQPIKLQRFSPRTVIMAIIGATALVVVLGSLNFAAVMSALQSANPWWILIAFLLGTLTWVGAAIPLVAFAPKKINLWNATLTQMAASIVSLVAPAGIGPAALNLRFLNREKLSTPVAVATVTLVQISQVLTSVGLLLLIVVGTGTSVTIPFPTMTLVWIFAAIATLLAAALAISPVRTWIWKKIQPSWDQAYPQLLWILGHPRQLLIALGGNLLLNLGYIGAFAATLAAFGYYMNPLALALTYLVSSTLGSAIPTPGGIGPVEAALTAGLQVAGIPTAVALSTAVLFRLVTFYGRIPIGWLALKRMEKKGLL